ncbi:rRNA pseudouridine synthase [Desulfovibrio sp. OttesenSCG-928-A18]|nr:rRNA pseudouridine synthase [Desulfovibrio sp. OttesenSCG-928-A18]
MSEGVRINKALADAGLCSRRKADELVASGRVSVNGAIVREAGLRVHPDRDLISVDGRVLAGPAAGSARQLVCLMLHKPVEVLSTARDPEGRRTVLDFVPAVLRASRLYPVGRLDYFSEGLLLLTNDGELTNRLTHPRYHLPRHYEVRVREQPSPSMFSAMRQGMTLREGEKLAPVEVRAGVSPGILLMTLHQGVNRQIRRMCRDLGLTILSLKRTGLGPLTLGDLAKGESRPLRKDEILALRRAVGLA